METTNLSKIKRDKMLHTINEIKKNITDEETLNNLSLIENELTKKKYGLIWEEHEDEENTIITKFIIDKDDLKEFERKNPIYKRLRMKEPIIVDICI